MRRPSTKVTPGMALALVSALALPSLPATAHAQAAKKAAAAADTRPLTRYVPRDNLVFYAGSEGLDSQAEGWQKTAAYKMLNETSLGLMLEDITTQFFEHILAARPNRKVSGADVLAIVKHMAKSGFVLALNTPERGPGSTRDIGVLVVRGAASKSARGPFSRLLGTGMGTAKTKTMMKAGRYLVVVPMTALPGSAADPAATDTWSWWAEKNDDLVVVLGQGNEDIVLSTIDGKDPKRPNAQAQPVVNELVRPEGAFTPLGVAFFDPTAVARTADPTGAATKITGTGLSRFDYRWGFQDNALVTIARLKAPRPRRGPLALLDQPMFDKGKLPPLPEGIESFTVVGMDTAKAYENLLASAATPADRARLTAPADALKTKTRVDLRKDLLGHLGTRFAFYVTPSTAGSAPAAPALGAANPLAGMLGAGAIPKFTLVAEVDDNAAFVRTLDNLMTGFNKVIREQAAQAAEATAPPAEPAKPKGRSGSASTPPPPSPEFKLTPSSNPTERSYVLNIPAAMARQIPAGYRPTIRLAGKQLVISSTPEAARAALEVKAGQWTPPADLAPAFDLLPQQLLVLGARDNRPTLPESLASLPATLQRAYNLIASPPPGLGDPSQPSPTGAASTSGLVFNIPMTRLPNPEELRTRLFPGAFAVTTDDQEIRWITRSAFPSVVSPTSVSMLAVFMPAFQAGRNAAMARAQAAAAGAGAGAAPGPGPGPGLTPGTPPPTTSGSVKPGPATKRGRASAVPKD